MAKVRGRRKILWFLSSIQRLKTSLLCCGERVTNPRRLVDVGSLRRRRVCKFDGPPPPIAMHRCNRGTSALFVTSTMSQWQYCVITSAIPGEALLAHPCGTAPRRLLGEPFHVEGWSCGYTLTRRFERCGERG